jgi:hypothetical protein
MRARDQIAPLTISQASPQAKSTRRLRKRRETEALSEAAKKRGKMSDFTLFFRLLRYYAKGLIFALSAWPLENVERADT